MKKDELVQGIADGANLTKSDAERALNALVEVLTAKVASGTKVQVPGLGTFEPRERAAREGRNPQTGETLKIAATVVPGFKPATAFKQAVAPR